MTKPTHAELGEKIKRIFHSHPEKENVTLSALVIFNGNSRNLWRQLLAQYPGHM